jgi:hypothetical protein
VSDDHRPDLDAVARDILDANRYMTLGTADAGGHPWVSPVFFAADGYHDLYWISSPEATHSRNLAAPARYRLYRARVSRHWVLDPGASPDRRTAVSP